MTELKKDILWRVYLVFAFICLFGLAIILQILRLQVVQGSYWQAKADSLTLSYRTIDAARGSIYANDGSLLGTSIPVYELRLDAASTAITDEFFYANVDSLSIQLSILFDDKSWKEYKHELTRARKKGERYFLIQRGVSFSQLKKARTFPILRLGRYKGGFIVNEKNRRALPFEMLAQRTIGYSIPGIKPVGLEGAYNNHLSGVGGKRLMQRIGGNVWMPLSDDNQIEPQDGSDILTTIDVNLQDVAENALLKQLSLHGAEHGCAILMEVATGEIRAIANLQRDSAGNYKEYYNFAIAESTEPGSTFKFISLVAGIEDGKIELTDTVDIEGGKKLYYDRWMRDSHESSGKLTVQRAFEVSSNVGISKVIYRNYVNRQQEFVDALYKMGIQKPLGLDIAGEPTPVIKNTKDKSWTGVTLPWMSIGYEIRLTPLQILTFYNAIANNGVMVKPIFVREISLRGKSLEKMNPQIINPTICSPATVQKAKKLLEGVVENGTAINLKNANYKIAGKTGTAQIANKNYGYKLKSQINYLASFVGYFPADNPRYSCIVVVSSPSNEFYYGNVVAGPVFKEIADKVYASHLDMHREYVSEPDKNSKALASNLYASGNRDDIEKVTTSLGLKNQKGAAKSEWVFAKRNDRTISVSPKNMKGVPDVSGMGLRDAIYLLENAGLLVKASGKGLVAKQSIPAGKEFKKGDAILIELM